MSALSRCIQSAAFKLLSAAATDPLVLHPSLRALVLASAAIAGVSAAVPVQAQDAGSAISQNSVSRWGEILGGVVGRSVVAAIGGRSSYSEIGRRTQDIAAQVGEEVGRNVGRTAVTEPFKPSKAAPSATHVPMPLTVSDRLDTAALNAIYAHGQAIEVSSHASNGSPSVVEAQNYRQQTVGGFFLEHRAAANQGFDVSPWAQSLMALSRQMGDVPANQFVMLGRPMMERLHRQGGPGYQVRDRLGRTNLPFPPATRMQVRTQTDTSQAPHTPQENQSLPAAQVPRYSPTLEAMRLEMRGRLVPVSADAPRP